MLPFAALRCPVTHIPMFPIPLFYSFPLETCPYPSLFPPLAAVPSCLASSGRKRGLVLGHVLEQPLSSAELEVGRSLPLLVWSRAPGQPPLHVQLLPSLPSSILVESVHGQLLSASVINSGPEAGAYIGGTISP